VDNTLNKTPAHALYLLGSLVILASFLLPWWMTDAAHSAGTHARKLTLAAALFMATLVVASVAGRNVPEALLGIGPLTALIAHFGYYNGIVKTQHFSDLEFTIFVDIGFFVALVGIGWGFAAVICLQLFRSSVISCVAMASLVVLAVILLYAGTEQNKAKLGAPPRNPIPEAATGTGGTG
jgi:hypothetical protein